MSTLDIAMTETEARQVTSRIKLLVNSIADTWDKVVGLIEQAQTGKAWQALGYPSWTAYVAEEFSGAVAGLARAERVPITAKLAETGMPIRAIASVVGVGKSTITRDLDEQVSRTGTPVQRAGVQHLNTSIPETVNTSSPKPITGMDGKEYVRNGRPTAAGMRDLAGAVPEVRRASRRRPLPDAYWDAVYDLDKALRRLEKLTADDRFDGNRERLAEQHSAERWPELIGRLALIAAALHPGVADVDD